MTDPARVKAFIKDAVREFRRVTPDWQPPFGTVFEVGKRHGFEVRVNGRTERAYRKLRLDDDAHEEDWGKLEEVWGDGKVFEVRLGRHRVFFLSPDLRKLCHVRTVLAATPAPPRRNKRA